MVILLNTQCLWWIKSTKILVVTIFLSDNLIFKCRLTCTTGKEVFKEKLIFNFALNHTTQLFWAVSFKRTIVCNDLANFDNTLLWCSTLAEKLYTIRESPHDMNK